VLAALAESEYRECVIRGLLVETKSTQKPTQGETEVFRLLVLASPERDDVGRTHLLVPDDAPIRVQRGVTTAGAIGLPDDEVSRVHSQLAFDCEERSWSISDAGSRNGTLVNGVSIEQQALASGDVLRLGGHLLLFQRLDGEACRRLIGRPHVKGDRLIGKSHAMLALREQIAAAAPMRQATLVLGETGVGKELVAETLHMAWGGGPFVPVNCAALPDQLAESELFGHARGAFTGAHAASVGLFGAADRGTLFLDEVGELPLALQAKLLRVLATGEVRALGEQQARRVDVRIVAATNRDLEQAIERGTFREDLYARLTGAVIRVPPLRERREDIPELVRHFLADADAVVEVDALEALLVNVWRRNVRELEHVVRAARPGMSGHRLSLAALPEAARRAVELRSSGAVAGENDDWKSLLTVRRDTVPEPHELRRALDHFKGNITRVAAFFGRERRQIYRWAEQMSLAIVESRTADDPRDVAPTGEAE
jgi:DNA-binding NtrC family response regulator